MRKGVSMEDSRKHSNFEKDFIPLPRQVWNKYRYLSIYASVVSTVLMYQKLRGK